MSALWARVRALPPWVFLAIGLGVLVTYAFPGYMSNDSFTQLLQARSGMRTDAHPPLMSFEWEILDAIVAGPLLMLLLQGCLALFGLYRIFGRVLSPRAAAMAASAVLIFPPVITTFAVIWKDSQMAAYLLAGIGCMVDERRRVRIVGLALMVAGCGMRHNGLAAAVPAVGLLFEWRPGMHWLRRYAWSAAAAVLVVALELVTTKVLTVSHVPISPATIDIVGIVANGKPRTDEQLRDLLGGAPLVVTTDIQAAMRRVYTPRNPIGYDHGPDRVFDLATTDDQRAALGHAWLQLLEDEPGVYFRYRARVFEELLDTNDSGLFAPVWNDFLESPEQAGEIDHLASRSIVQMRLAIFYSEIADNTVLFEPAFYLWLALALLVLAIVWRDRLAGAVLVSGLLYELAYFPVVATPDFRYSHWLIVCTCAGAVMLFARRLRTR